MFDFQDRTESIVSMESILTHLTISKIHVYYMEIQSLWGKYVSSFERDIVISIP